MDETKTQRLIPATVIFASSGIYTVRLGTSGELANTFEMVESMISPQFIQVNRQNYRAYIFKLKWIRGTLAAICVVSQLYNFTKN